MTSKVHYLDPYPKEPQAVLLLHGLGADGSSWALQFDALAAIGCRPIAPDIPGFGASTYDGSGWSIRRVACRLANLVDELKLPSVHVVGLSMGGVIAQQFTLDYPGLVRKLILASTFSTLRPANFSQGYYFLQRLLVVHILGLNAQAKIVSRRVFPREDQEFLREKARQQIESANPRAYRAAMRCLGLFDVRNRLKEIAAPTLVVCGENDSTISPDVQKKLAAGIPTAKLVVVPTAGHAVTIDHFEEFNELMVEFIMN